MSDGLTEDAQTASSNSHVAFVSSLYRVWRLPSVGGGKDDEYDGADAWREPKASIGGDEFGGVNVVEAVEL